MESCAYRQAELGLDGNDGAIGCAGAGSQRHGRGVDEGPGDAALFGVLQHALLGAAGSLGQDVHLALGSLLHGVEGQHDR